MKVFNKFQKQQHEERIRLAKERHARELAEIESYAPEPIAVKQHTGDAPKKIGQDPPTEGLRVMPGDFHGKVDEQHIVIHADDIGKNGAWEEVK